MTIVIFYFFGVFGFMTSKTGRVLNCSLNLSQRQYFSGLTGVITSEKVETSTSPSLTFMSLLLVPHTLTIRRL